MKKLLAVFAIVGLMGTFAFANDDEAAAKKEVAAKEEGATHGKAKKMKRAPKAHAEDAEKKAE